MATVTLPHTFAANALAQASQVNANFSSITTEMNGNLDGANIANDSITAAKIVGGAVTTAKIQDDAISTAKIQDAAVTDDKFAPLTISAKTGSYTLTLADYNSLVTMDSASAMNLTIPTNASVAFPTGTAIKVAQLGGGQVTLVPSSGVTMVAYLDGTKIAGRGGAVVLVKTGTNTWLAEGLLVP